MLPMLDHLSPVLIALGFSALFCLLIVLTSKWHGRWSFDHAAGLQKFHHDPTPRIGGLALIASSWLTFIVSYDLELINLMRPILVCALIPFFFGFREDLTKDASVWERMSASLAATAAVIWLTGIHLTHVDIWGLDSILQISVIAVLFTLFAVAGLTNALNILDGFNGLASGVAVIILLYLAAMAIQAGDPDLADMAFILAGSLIGFMVFNYPLGKIFLGDSGAYFIGFMLAWMAILLPMRNPEVSPWASLLACAYPVWEAIYSMHRRIQKKSKTTQADDLHLHSLIKRRWVRKHWAHRPAWFRNSAVAPAIWGVTLILGGLALRFMSEPLVLMLIFLVFVLLYALVYRVLLAMPDQDSPLQVGAGISIPHLI